MIDLRCDAELDGGDESGGELVGSGEQLVRVAVGQVGYELEVGDGERLHLEHVLVHERYEELEAHEDYVDRVQLSIRIYLQLDANF